MHRRNTLLLAASVGVTLVNLKLVHDIRQISRQNELYLEAIKWEREQPRLDMPPVYFASKERK